MRITFVKKIKADGSPCRKCREVERRLEEAGLMPRIDCVVVADERDEMSIGMQLAAKHQVEQAPFFIVENESGAVRIYTIFYRFLKEVLKREVSEQEEIAELMHQDPDLDYL
jgi:hypothetical protein